MNLLDELFPNVPRDANGNTSLTVRFGHGVKNTLHKLNPALLDDPRFTVSADVPLYVMQVENEGKVVATLTMRTY